MHDSRIRKFAPTNPGVVPVALREAHLELELKRPDIAERDPTGLKAS